MVVIVGEGRALGARAGIAGLLEGGGEMIGGVMGGGVSEKGWKSILGILICGLESGTTRGSEGSTVESGKTSG